MSEYCMTAGKSEDVTACFGAWNVKTAPKRAFSACPKRPGRVASGYCVSAGLKGEVEGTGEPLGKLLQWIPFSYQDGKKYQIVVEKMIPEDVNRSVHVIL